MNMLTVLGGKGFIGGHFVDLLKKQNSQYIANEKLDYNVKTNDVISYISTVDNYNVFENPYIDIDTNLTVLIKLLESWRNRVEQKRYVGCFNFVSSWFVYGNEYGLRFLGNEIGLNGFGASETDRCDPKGFYGITKRAAEQLLISYCETYGLNYRILRLSNVIGPGDKKVSKKKNALTYMINQMKEDKLIELYDDGDFYRDFIHVDDCVTAIDLVLTKGDENAIYNIGGGVPVKFKNAIEHAWAKMGSRSEIVPIVGKEFHRVVQAKSFFMCTAKLRKLGFVPKYDIYQAIDTLI